MANQQPTVVNFASVRKFDYPDFLDIQLKSFQDFFQIETNPDNREVYYEFELINVPETQKQLHQENGIHEVSLEKIKRAIHMLQHEECSTQRAVEDIQEFFQDRFNTNLSMDINNILEKRKDVYKVPSFIKFFEI